MRLLLVVFALAIGCSSERARPKLELVAAPAVPDVAAYVSGAVASATSAHKRVIVYVGAEWCEPCRHELPVLSALQTGVEVKGSIVRG